MRTLRIVAGALPIETRRTLQPVGLVNGAQVLGSPTPMSARVTVPCFAAAASARPGMSPQVARPAPAAAYVRRSRRLIILSPLISLLPSYLTGCEDLVELTRRSGYAQLYSVGSPQAK